MGPDTMILVFWMLNFKPAFSLSCFTFIKRFFSFTSLSAFRVVSSAYLRLLIFLLAILIPACASSSLGFHVMHSAYKLNKQGDNIQSSHTPFPILNQSVVPCPVPTVTFCPTYRFLRRQVSLSGTPISLRMSHSLLWSTQSKALSIPNEAEADVFLEFPWFLHDSTNVGNLISSSSAFSKPSLFIWNFSFQVLLKLSLKDFEHNLDSMWNEHNYTVVGTFFVIVLLCDWNENWTSPSSPEATAELSKSADIEYSTLTVTTLGILNSSAGILLPPLAL